MAENRAKKIAMAIGIFVVLMLFSGFGGSYIQDYFEDNCQEGNQTGFCESNYPEANQCELYNTQETCESRLSDGCFWNIYHDQECYDRGSLAFTIFTTIVGIIALAIGFFIKNNGTISGGLIGGGIGSLVMAIISYWSNINELIRVLLIGIVLTILLLIAWKKLRD